MHLAPALVPNHRPTKLELAENESQSSSRIHQISHYWILLATSGTQEIIHLMPAAVSLCTESRSVWFLHPRRYQRAKPEHICQLIEERWPLRKECIVTPPPQQQQHQQQQQQQQPPEEEQQEEQETASVSKKPVRFCSDAK